MTSKLLRPTSLNLFWMPFRLDIILRRLARSARRGRQILAAAPPPSPSCNVEANFCCNLPNVLGLLKVWWLYLVRAPSGTLSIAIATPGKCHFKRGVPPEGELPPVLLHTLPCRPALPPYESSRKKFEKIDCWA